MESEDFIAVWKTICPTKLVAWVHNGVFAPTPGSRPGRNWQEARAVKIIGWVENMTFIPFPAQCPRCDKKTIVLTNERYRDKERRYLERQDWHCSNCDHRWILGPGRQWG